MKVFISYRRGDAVAIAGRLYDRLCSRLGAGSVFMDVENIPVGRDFTRSIKDSIVQSDVLLVLIGPEWLALLEKSKAREDVVTEEIAIALSHEVLVIPVLLGNTSMPRPSDLPPAIQGLAMRNALRLEPGERFSSDVERLVQALRSSTGPRSSLFEWFRSWLSRATKYTKI
jgi:TIR domain-containing protein